MAITQEQVDEWFAANPDATPELVAKTVQQLGGLEANTGLAGMLANRYSVAEPDVTNYYNAYTAPATVVEPPTSGLSNVTGEKNTVLEDTSSTPESNLTQANAVVTTPTTPIGGLPTSNATTNATTSVAKAPTLISSDGKEYAGDTLLKLAQQLGASTTESNLAGSAYGVKKGNIGFDYTEANKLFGDSNATQQVFLDAARGLIDQGITDLSQLTTKDIMGDASVQPEVDENGNATGRYVAVWGGDSEGLNAQRRVLTPEEAAKVKSSTVMSGDSETTQYTPLNIALNKGIFDKNGKEISGTNELSLGSTYTGPGGTSYQLTFDPATGKPAFKTTGFSTSDADAIGPLSTIASLAFPGAAPFIKAGMAAYNLSQGNTTGAILSGLGAAGDFGALGAADIDALANAGDYSGAVNLYENSPLAQNVGNINLAKTAVSGADALRTGNVPGVINATMSGLNQAGVTLPSGVTTAVQLANLTSALTSGNTPAALNAVGDLTGSSNAKVAASALNVMNLMGNPNADPTAVMNAVTNLSKNIGTSNATATKSGLTGTNVSDAGDDGDDVDVNSLIGDFSTKFANIEGNPTTQVAGTLNQMPGEKPSWLSLDKGEKIIGKDEEVGTGDKATYLVQIDNPEDPDKPFIYQTYFDAKTGQTMYAPYGTMKTGGENLGENVLIQSLGYKPNKPIPDWTAPTGEKGLPSTVKPTDEIFSKAGTSGGLPVTPANLASVLASNVTGDKTDGTGAKANTAVVSTVGGVGGDPSKTTTVGGLGGADAGTTGTKGTTVTGGAGGTGALSTVTGGGTGGTGAGGGGGGDGTGGGGTTTTINNGDGTNTTVVVAPTGTVTTHECKDGFHWDETAKACVANVVTPPVVTPPVVTPPVVTPPVVTPPVVVPPPVVTPPVVTPPVVKEPVVTSPLSSAGIAPTKLDSSPQFLAGASPQKRMELAKLQQLFASLTPELAAVFSERGFQPPKYKEEKEEETKEDSKEDKSVFGNLTDGMYNPQSKFMATGGSVLDSLKPKYVESAKYLSAAPVHGTGGVDGPLKLAILKHLKQSISAPPRSMDGLAQGGLPSKYAKAAPKGHKPEFITGLTGYYAQGEGTGQSDDIPAMLHDGDYVIDADAVAALGDGSSKAGAQVLSQFQSKVPHKMSAGGQAVPAKIADGEYVFPEAFVTAIGGGDNKQGSKLLDAMREELRAHKRSAPTSKIPPKAKSPLDYLRMAKG